MSFNPEHLLNTPASLLSHPGLMAGLDNGREEAPAEPPPPFDQGLYLNAYGRLGLLGINNVAELGCGVGNFVSIMATKGMRPEMYVGVDNNHQSISTAKAAYPGWKFVYGDMRDIRIRAEYERFGAFLMLDLIDTLEDDLEFLASLPPEKPLLFSITRTEKPEAKFSLADSIAVRDRYSSILNIKTVGRYYNANLGLDWSIVLASKW
jgi:SAM-dependent methyltransferase